MKQKNPLRRLAAMLLLSGALVLSVAATQGTQADPLVTLGYLTEKFLPQVTQQIEAKAVQRDKDLEVRVQAMVNAYSAEMEKKFTKALGGSGGTQTAVPGFVEVSLSAGQKLSLSAGGELLFRSGTATCLAPSSPGLVDTTAGTILEGGGALVINHLYLSTANGRGLTAGDGVIALVRGTYTVS